MRRWYTWWHILLRPTWRWLVLIPLALLGAFQSIREELPISLQQRLQLPGFIHLWPWYIWFIIILVFVIFIILESAYREITKLKDTQSGESLVLTPHTYAIGLSGRGGYPNEPDNAEWLCLEIFVNPIGKPIDTLDLIIDGNIIPANYWPSKNVTAFNVYFNVTEWRRKGKNQVELIAHVDGKIHSSGRITIDFNVEVFGIHRI